ncbi:hypothetical protein GA0061096_3555 [Fictibacillus enclensis]|uniref:GGDEF domain-containing protein n=1 Tax=Fictibacillus enclensis TaxID=1017270 RepID=A0A0V8J4Z0_9BACL|nr:hypothetical protein [Fictibacillus enclensis]KSU81963.1 hypothetical protein AS030_16910 [Fictibacillus enclensis]SCC28408.1 hypothetical protein GA0061096_3555 [Fictibacillus enclensis]
MSGQIFIGVIAPSVIARRIQRVIKGFPTFTLVLQVSEDMSDVVTLTKELGDKVDVLLFSSYEVYKLVKNHIDFEVPAHYIPLKASGLYSALYRLMRKHTEVKGISVDTLSVRDVSLVLSEVEEEIAVIPVQEERVFQTTSQILKRHQQYFIEGKSQGALTGSKEIAEDLERLGVPNQWITPTEQDIINAMERALLSCKKRQNKDSQIVMGRIRIVPCFEEKCELDGHRIQKKKSHIRQLICDYSAALEAHLMSVGEDEFLLVTTRGIFERVSEGYKSIPLLQSLKDDMELSLSVGIGFGLSAKDAGNHAWIALRQSMQFGSNQCFIVREDKSVVGPVEMSNPLIYSLSVTDSILLLKAEKTGMTAAYLGKMLAQIKRSERITYTAQEIADILGVTIRSAHRILLQCLDAGLIQIVGEEKLASKGRPRQIYSFHFIEDYLSGKG